LKANDRTPSFNDTDNNFTVQIVPPPTSNDDKGLNFIKIPPVTSQDQDLTFSKLYNENRQQQTEPEKIQAVEASHMTSLSSKASNKDPLSIDIQRAAENLSNQDPQSTSPIQKHEPLSRNKSQSQTSIMSAQIDKLSVRFQNLNNRVESLQSELRTLKAGNPGSEGTNDYVN